MIKIILCAYNEAQNLKTLLANLNHELSGLKQNFEIIICIDGTTDESESIINEFAKICKIKILPPKNQRGLGVAFKRIFLEVINNSSDDDLIISLDADNSHNPSQIPAMIEHFEKNSLDFLVASRFCDHSSMQHFPLHRKFISKTVSLLLQTLFPIKKISGKKIQDYTSGYRIYKAKKLKDLYKIKKDNFIREPEFTYTCELLVKLSQLQGRFDEIAILYEYEKKLGISKLRIGRNFYRLLILLLRRFK